MKWIGAFPVLSLMVGEVVTRLVPDNGPSANFTDFEGLTKDQQRVLVASSVTFLAGIFQVNWIHRKCSVVHAVSSGYSLKFFNKPGFFSLCFPLLCFLLQLAMGALQAGFIVTYLSDTLVSGFTTAAAVQILVSQLRFVLGLTVPGISGPLAIIYVSSRCVYQVSLVVYLLSLQIYLLIYLDYF